MNMKPAIPLFLDVQDVNVIVSLLRQAPMAWDISDPLLNKIDAQIKKAMEAEQTTASAAETNSTFRQQ